MIVIPRKFYEQIRRDGEVAYPNESCGVMFGVLRDNGDREVLSCRSVLNQFDELERYHRFQIDAETMMMLELEARRNKLDIVGFYHSHPDAPAIPSEYDRVHALPVYSYVITSVANGVAENTASWILSGGNIFMEEVIKIGDGVNPDDVAEFHEE